MAVESQRSLIHVTHDDGLCARFRIETRQLSNLTTLDDVLTCVVQAARALARADHAELTAEERDSDDGGFAFWSGRPVSPPATTLERPIVVAGRPYAKLRVTTWRPTFLSEEEVLLDLLAIHAALAIEKSASQVHEDPPAGRSQGSDQLTPAPRLDETVREVGDVRIDLRRYQTLVAGLPVHLTLSEFRVLELLTEQPGRAYSRREIVERLWGTDSPCTVRSADAHIARLRAKLERDPHEPTLLVSVRGVGYRLAVD